MHGMNSSGTRALACRKPGLVAVCSLAALAWLWTASASAELLTADRAVQIALQRNSQMVSSQAAVLEARGALYGSYSGILPRISADLTRSGSRIDRQGGSQLFGTIVTPSATTDNESYSTTPSISGSWPVLNLSALMGVSSGRAGLKASQLRKQASRNDVALSTRQLFYEVVKSIHLARVADGALKRARDDEQRVRALFEVGSVSRSDVLKAQVATAQSQLDSLSAQQNVVVQRIALAEQLAMREPELGEVDTVLAAEPREYEEAALVAEAGRNRPDLMAAEAELRAARAGHASARLARLPYVSVQGSADFNPRRTFSQKSYGTFPVTGPQYVGPDGRTITRDTLGFVTDPEISGRSSSDRTYQASIALTWDIFAGFATDARIASARARLLRARESCDASRRNLEAEVHQTLFGYHLALEGYQVSERGLESATENLNLIQQKYNVGSSTILELVDARVNLERAQSSRVSALAAIRVAEAQIDRVRGRSE
jgi:outer membrane protein TolC